MFEPAYTITPKMLVHIKRIAVLVAELNSKAVSRVILLELSRRSAALSSHTSTRIEGNPLPLTEVKKILKTRPKNLRESELEVINYNEALEMLGLNRDRNRSRFSIELILDIHRTVMSNLMDSYFCGRLRSEPVVIHNPRTGEVMYLPPDDQDVNQLMTDLVAFIKAKRDELDPLILAGLFHKQFVVIHPFQDGNGRTARLATKVLLAEMGLDMFSLFSFENYYNQNISRYFKQVGLFGNYYDVKDSIDYTLWMEYFMGGIVDELLRVKSEIEAMTASPETTLKSHHHVVLHHIAEHGYIIDRDYARLTDRAKATRALDFKKLMAMGLIDRYGKGRNTHYKLKT